jgi:hypothetical protein
MQLLANRCRSVKKLLAVLSAMLLCLLASPRPAFALQKALCSTVTCTGGTPNLELGGGGMSHPEIVPIFWGTYWSSTTTSPTRGQMVGAIQAIVNSAYLGALSQYGGDTGTTVGPARMVPAAPIYTGTTVSGATCVNGDSCDPKAPACSDGTSCDVRTGVDTTIDSVIGSGAVPGPAEHADMLYIVFVPPGDTQADWNAPGTCSSACGAAYNGLSYHAAMVSGGDFAGLSHEIAEAITNNVSNDNCTYVSSGNHANQISDLCGCYHEDQLVGSSNPIKVSAYWSQVDAGSGLGCVIPEGWSGVWMYDFYDWTQVYAGTVRQIYAGDYGVVATDTNDNLIGITGLSGTLGGPGAMFAVGNSSILALAPDASAVWEYNGSWTSIGGGATSVLSGGYKVATNFDGEPWVYDASWTDVGGAADQFLVNHGGIVAIATDHQSVWLDATGTSGGWANIGGSASELFVGVDHGIAETALASSKDVSYYSGSGTTWVPQGGPGNMFAVTMDDILFGLNPARSAVFLSSGTSTPNPPWIGVGTTAGRLVARSDSGGGLYATGSVVY